MPEEIPEGSIVITPKEFYDGVSRDIAEIKHAVSPLPSLAQTVQDHETRLKRVERALWVACGVALASGGTNIAFLLQ